MNIPLKDIPDEEWQDKYQKVLEDPYIQKKYNRSKRLKEKSDYLNRYLPFLKNGGKSVLDIGPGPGEFLEVCRSYGNTICGSDAPIDDCEMGGSYISLSYLMTKRQGLDVKYDGLDMSSYEDSSFDVINSQGSIEQVFRDCLEGIPHKEKRNCTLLSWREENATKERLYCFLVECYRCLRNNGILLIYGNGAKNVGYYDKIVQNLAKEIGFKVKRKNNRLHIMTKSTTNDFSR